jgi:hypothetical protein
MSSDKTQPELALGKRLYIYAVLVRFYNYIVVKFGDHRDFTLEDAKKYAMDQTVGKLRGLVGKDDIQLIFCEDITEAARKMGTRWVDANSRGFDNFVRHLMPGVHEYETNICGGSSHELHFHHNETNIKKVSTSWNNAVITLKTGKHVRDPKQYIARPYTEEMFKKTEIGCSSNKFLLAATTGAGKEASTLAELLYLHDNKKFGNDKVHVVCATIPSTALELITELSSVKGMTISVGTGVCYADFSRFKVYCMSTFDKKYSKDIKDSEGSGTGTALSWYKKNVTVIKTTDEIPDTHDDNIVPILLGSFPDLGLKAKTGELDGKFINKKYEALFNRIGILSIGEAHQFLGNSNNKLWTNISKLKYEFLFLITGTPYDFIFNEDRGMLYFKPEERTVFSRNDLYKEKRNCNPHYQNFPDMIYYALDFGVIIEEMKKSPDWDDDEVGFSYEKLHEFVVAKQKFKYEQALCYFYRRLFGLDNYGNSDPLSVFHAKNLCEVAKKHLLVALPVGKKDADAKKYIGILVKLLVKNGCLGVYQPLEALTDNLKNINNQIKNNKQPTITFTCRKFLTGTNIPAWGSFILLRKIGDSIKFFEQSTGRIIRPYEGKTNAGVFLGDIDNAMNIMISVEEKLSIERGENFSYSEIIKETLQNYFFFSGQNGSWKEIDGVDMMKRMKELSAKGVYGISFCIKDLKTPADFDKKMNNTTGTLNDTIILNSNGNEGAKNTKTIDKKTQLGFDFGGSEEEKKKWFKNLVKRHLATARLMCYTYGIPTIQEFVIFIEKALSENNKDILKEFGVGVEYVPNYMNDSEQINITYANRWLSENHNLTIEQVLELFEDENLHNYETNFVHAPNRLVRRIVSSVLKHYKGGKILDMSAGRGTFLIEIIKQAKENNIAINPVNLYYNDIDNKFVMFFKKINNEYSLGIPEENITCGDALSMEWLDSNGEKMTFGVIIGNPPYQGQKEIDGGRAKTIWTKFVTKAHNIIDNDGYLAFIHPAGWRKVKSENINDFEEVWNILVNNMHIEYLSIQDVADGLKTFGAGTRYDWYVAKKTNSYEKNPILIKGEDGKEFMFDKFELNYIPNSDIEVLTPYLCSKDENPCKIIHDSTYDARVPRKHMSTTKSDEFCYPVIHTTPQEGVKYRYTNSNTNGHFGIKKVIFGDSGVDNAVLDLKGEYGMTHHAIAIPINDEKDGNELITFLKSENFRKIQKMTCWSNYAIEPKVFLSFKEGFWRDNIKK